MQALEALGYYATGANFLMIGETLGYQKMRRLGQCIVYQRRCVQWEEALYLLQHQMSRDMIFPTMRHFDKCKLRRACVQPFFKLRNTKCCFVSSIIVIECSSGLQSLWSDCAYAQADMRLCWSHIPHCWKSHVAAQMWRDFSSMLLAHVPWYRITHMLCLKLYAQITNKLIFF